MLVRFSRSGLVFIALYQTEVAEIRQSGILAAIGASGNPSKKHDLASKTRMANGVHWTLLRPKKLRSPVHLKENI